VERRRRGDEVRPVDLVSRNLQSESGITAREVPSRLTASGMTKRKMYCFESKGKSDRDWREKGCLARRCGEFEEFIDLRSEQAMQILFQACVTCLG
jgi:hypothetical protein